MSGIFGIVNRSGASLAPPAMENMASSLAPWEGHGFHTWQSEIAGLGVATLVTTPEAGYECLPRYDRVSGIAFAAAGRIDNRAELGDALGIPQSEQPRLSDGEFMLQAYLRWEARAATYLFGDWAFAAWHPAERKMFLARDHLGNTSLFYYADTNTLAFAPTHQALLNLNLFPVELDELYLAQILVSWPAYQGERTIHRPIRRLPPAHTLTITPDRMEVCQYWRLEAVPELRWSRREDYVDAFSSLFNQAVRARVRVPQTQSVAVTLSGGLDSSSVTAAAAGILRSENQRLAAFTSVPLTDSGKYAGNRFGDEYPFAAATAQFAGNVDLHAVMARDLSPIRAIRRQLEILDEPSHNAGNAYWILEMERVARSLGFRVLLTGQLGNAGVSWTGDPLSQPLRAQLRQLGIRGWATLRFQAPKGQLGRTGCFTDLKLRRVEQESWYRQSAIRSDFAKRLNLLEQRMGDPNELYPRTPQERRYRVLRPGRSTAGSMHAQMGAAQGLEIRDPTADVRLLEFVLSVPDKIFIDPQTGTNRWLIREAMKGKLPDEVRLNRRRGRQAADRVSRLRACMAEVNEAFIELEAGAAAAYVDVPYMREVWEMVKRQDTPEALHKSATVLTRGIGAGLFVNQFTSRPAVRSKAAAAYAGNQMEPVW